MFRKIKDYLINNFCVKYNIPYYLLMCLLAVQLKKMYSCKDLNITDYDAIFNIFLNKCNREENANIYIILQWGSGDVALYYLIIDNIISSIKSTRVAIVADRKFLDILNLYKKKYSFLNTIWLEKGYLSSSEKIIKGKLNIQQCDEILDLRAIPHNNRMKFICKVSQKNSNYEYFKALKFESLTYNNSKYLDYEYSDISYEKLKYILSYVNVDSIILCNFENLSYRLAWKDSINFSNYIAKIVEIAKKNHLKFVVNSVYNNEKLYDDENILITRLNFQEIIWLSEHKKIKLFISERNWLNDVFKVFYPEINQIIYYPDYYNRCVDKNVYKKIYWEDLHGADVKDFWHLPGINIFEDIRWNYFSTVEKYITKLL